MTRALGRDHRYINVIWRHDATEMDVEPVGKHQRLSGRELGSDALVIDTLLRVIRHEHHNDVCLMSRIANGHHRQPVGLDEIPALAAFVQTDDHVDTAVMQIQRMRVSLTAISKNRDLLPLKQGKVRVLVVIDLRHEIFSSRPSD